jgi:hypothetical protein
MHALGNTEWMLPPYVNFLFIAVSFSDKELCEGIKKQIPHEKYINLQNSLRKRNICHLYF